MSDFKSFNKSPIKLLSDKEMNDWEKSLMNETILNKPPDVAKLLHIIQYNNNNNKDFRSTETELKQLAIDSVKQWFDDSGEAATENCFEICREYGFIKIETNSEPNSEPNSNLKRFIVCPKNELEVMNDWFCFDCDTIIGKTNRQLIKCEKCFRVFHRKCCQVFNDIKSIECRYCERINTFETNGFINNNQRVDQIRMNRLIGFLLDFVYNRMKEKIQKMDQLLEENEYIFVFKQMKLSLIKEKVVRQEYKSLPEFDDDFFQYMHNLRITQIQFESTSGSQHLLDLREHLLKELNELRKCVDCYERANDKELHDQNKDWFSLPCEPFHKPVFVKLKNSPYWPAKIIIKYEDKNKSEVCFFEAEKVKEKTKNMIFKKCDAKPSDIKEIDDNDVLLQIKNNQRLIKPMEMLVKYLRNLIPDNKNYEEIIDKINKNNLTPKITNSLTDNSIEDSIESVIKNLKTPSKPTKSSRKKESKTTLKVTQQSTKKNSRNKDSIPSGSASVRSLSPPVLPKMVETLDNLDDSLSINQKVQEMNISEEMPSLEVENETITESTTETPNTIRRSTRSSSFREVPQKEMTETKKTSIRKKSASKRKAKNANHFGSLVEKTNTSTESISVPLRCEISNPLMYTALKSDATISSLQSEQMDVDSQDTYQTVEAILNNSEDSHLQNISETFSFKRENNLTQKTVIMTQQNNNESYVNPMDLTINSKQMNSNESLKSTVSKQSDVITTIPSITEKLTTTTTTTSMISALTTTQTTTQPTATITSAPKIVETLVETYRLTSTPSTSAATNYAIEIDNQKENINDENVSGLMSKIKELLEITGTSESIFKTQLTEIGVLINFYSQKVIDKLSSLETEKKNFVEQLNNVKKKSWCAVCNKEAKHHCCVRFYCSKECQCWDWKHGHSSQCLERKNIKK